jgi:type I restriction enzyme, S subunit
MAMNNETMMLLERHFDAAFAASDGIKKLRELILTLAMQGKLVPQDPNDEPASELLKAIEIEKKRLVKEGKIKQPKPLAAVELEEVSYDLPDSWEWVHIRDICHDWGQKTPDDLFTYIDVGSIDNTKGMICDDIQVLEGSEAPSRARKIVRQGTVIYSTVRPYLLNIAIIEQEYSYEPIASTAFAIVHPYKGVINRFVYYYLKSPVFIRFVELTMKGVAYPAINDGDFFRGIFPLPPLMEQCQIVAEIDRLMARCDELEKLRADRSQKLLTVHTAALDALLKAKESSDFSTAWHFITQNFSELYSVKDNVAQLRKTILQLAVMGKLVPQDPNDEPASELLKAIELEKKRLVKEGKIKQSKPLLKINLKDVPYELPNGWKWVRLGELTQVITKGSSPNWQGIQYVNEGEGILFVTSENVGSYNLLLKKKKFVESRFNEIEPRSILQRKDILMNIVGASIGRTAIFDLDVVANINQAVTIIRLIDIADYKYFLHFFNSSICIDYMYDKQVDNARPNLSMGNISIFNIPLPPLAEQGRIVAEIDRLMALCDRLEESIEAAKGKRTDLLNALMSQV